jgi:hypothetical protein
MPAGAGLACDQDRHVMRQSRTPARRIALRARWSWAGSDHARLNLSHRRRKCIAAVPTDTSNPYRNPDFGTAPTDGTWDEVIIRPTIDVSARVKSP